MKNSLLKLLFMFAILFQSCSVNDPHSDNDLITAFAKLDDIESVALDLSKGLILKSIVSKNVKISGQAETWIYKYSSGGIAVDYYFHAKENEVKFDSTSIFILDGEGFIVDQWFDSDEAMKIAEENGGKEFRQSNLDYTIEISLAEPIIPNLDAFWYIKYISQNGNPKILHLGINNSTKEVGLYY